MKRTRFHVIIHNNNELCIFVESCLMESSPKLIVFMCVLEISCDWTNTTRCILCLAMSVKASE